jgi:hypothetical protein
MYKAFSSFVGLVSVWSYKMNGGKLVNFKFGKPIAVDLIMPGQGKVRRPQITGDDQGEKVSAGNVAAKQ